jgi:glycosyltransferase involved in cell wall biosynthesis
MKILLIQNVAWDRSLGAAKVMIELADQWREMGCEVEKLSLEDYWQSGKWPGPWEQVRELLWQRFPEHARAYVKQNGRRFDVIEAHQGILTGPHPGREPRQLWVARSVGLHSRYANEERRVMGKSRRGWNPRGLWHYWRTERVRRSMDRDVPLSFDAADVINLSCEDDAKELEANRGWAQKILVQPFGLSEERRQELGAVGRARLSRPAGKNCLFLGQWNERKGAEDLPGIVRLIRSREPEARFVLAGVGMPEATVLSFFDEKDRPYCRVLPRYGPEQLPDLLASADCGLFPSRFEGFGFVVLEMIASGLPTAVYDAPGVRDIMRGNLSSWMAPLGKIEEVARQILEWFRQDEDGRAACLEEAARTAREFAWKKIAAETLQVYRIRLEQASP